MEIVNLDWKVFFTVFGAVFIAELGDKTQLATMLFATDRDVSKWTIFAGASAALIVASAMGVMAGSLLSDFIDPRYLHYNVKTIQKHLRTTIFYWVYISRDLHNTIKHVSLVVSSAADCHFGIISCRAINAL